jgi:hypothetical protein
MALHDHNPPRGPDLFLENLHFVTTEVVIKARAIGAWADELRKLDSVTQLFLLASGGLTPPSLFSR